MREPRWDGKLEWDDTIKDGDLGERVIKRMLNLGVTSYEVKNDQQALRTGNVFIETECQNESTGQWYPSGINSTQADVWFYILNIKPFLMLAAQPAEIKQAIRGRTIIEPARAKPPTRGVLIKLDHLLHAIRANII